MSGPRKYDVVVIGGGIVGLATAMAVLRRAPAIRLQVLEAEERLAAHQTGHNSGVIHSGLYYRPGSLKASNCRAGRAALLRFCDEHGVRYELCGKLVVAPRPDQLPALDELERRGRQNGLGGLERLRAEQIREREPHVAGIAGLYVPEAGIVDYREVVEAMAGCVRQSGGEITTRARVRTVTRRGRELTIESTAGELATRAIISCAGLQSDRLARRCGIDPAVRIAPFRGEYYTLTEAARRLVRNLVYPVPDVAFPFLGVHFTRRIDGTVEAGPNAVLALKREGYHRWAFSARDAAAIFGYPGFWRLARRYWRMGCGEIWRSLNKGAFVRDLQALVPEITESDLRPGGAGVRAQALDRRGALLDDFHLLEAEGMVHVLNAPSPAATAAISIGDAIAARAIESLGLDRNATNATR